MGTTTRRSIPYPESTDPVAAGAVAMQDLAEAVDLFVVPPDADHAESVNDVGSVSTANTWTAALAGAVDFGAVDVLVGASGRVLVIVSAEVHNNVGTGYTSVGARLSGADLVGSVDPTEDQVLGAGGGETFFHASVSFIVDGLTPAGTLTADMVYRTSAVSTTGYVDRRRIDLIPLP